MSRFSAARGATRDVRRVKIEGEGVPWSVLITDVAPRAVRTIRRSMLLRRKRMSKESAVQFVSFVEALLKQANVGTLAMKGLSKLPMPNFFARAAGALPPRMLSKSEQVLRRLSPADRNALLMTTGAVSPVAVRPPVWL